MPVVKARRRDTPLVLIGSASQLVLACAVNPAYTAITGLFEHNACADDSQRFATHLQIASGLGLHTVRLDGSVTRCRSAKTRAEQAHSQCVDTCGIPVRDVLWHLA